VIYHPRKDVTVRDNSGGESYQSYDTRAGRVGARAHARALRYRSRALRKERELGYFGYFERNSAARLKRLSCSFGLFGLFARKTLPKRNLPMLRPANFTAPFPIILPRQAVSPCCVARTCKSKDP
jgi:hypothetical protein